MKILILISALALTSCGRTVFEIQNPHTGFIYRITAPPVDPAK